MSLPVIFPPVVVAGAADATLTYNGLRSTTSAASAHTFSAVSLSTAASDRRVIVSVCRNTATTVSSVTIAGISATAAVTTGGAGIWIADVPTGTSGDIVVTFGSSVTGLLIACYSAYGLKSSTARGTASAASAALVHDLDVNAAKGGVIIAHSTKTLAVAATTDWVGATEHTTVGIGVGVGDTVTFAEDVLASSGSPLDVSITWDNASSMRSVAASFR